MTRLKQGKGDALIVRQQIVHGSLQYQFSKQLYVRLIGEMNLLKHATAPNEYGERKGFSVESMLSYKLNPFTVFFIGANIGGEDNPYINRRGLSSTDQTIYVKYQYLWSVL